MSGSVQQQALQPRASSHHEFAGSYDSTDRHVQRCFDLAANRKILIAVDLDGATLKHPPGQHNTHREHGLVDSLITIAAFCPAGPITGRPQMFVDTALSGLLGNQQAHKAFAATEGGAMIVDAKRDLLYRSSFPDVEGFKHQFLSVVERYPGAFIEDHTNCSVIVGLTKVPPNLIDQAMQDTINVARSLAESANQIGILHGNHIGVNSHVNVVPEGVNKGDALRIILSENFAAGMVPIVFGDDKPDEAMFRVALEHGGVTVGVGPNAPKNSQIVLEHYGQSQQLIADIAAHVQRGPIF